jgi:flagellum-specific peptidoglycan hydrolase FlgJ
MIMIKYFLLPVFLCGILSFSVPEEIAISYIDLYKDLAVAEMHRTGIPASIILAQAMHESQCGKSDLAVNSNNHFGIKCKSYWKGESYYHIDDDYRDGTLIKSCFRSYNTIIDSYVDHSNFLKYSSHYFPLFQFDKTDYKSWAEGLQKCGYATDPNYAAKLIAKIEEFNLHSFDQWEDPVKLLKEKQIKMLNQPTKTTLTDQQ